ncbi:trypsin-like peptidase domain-containing protein [Amycolatopsis sp. H6(2020)]|nr:trypsin-like peptidase domain-containing protein [Amycolatopsis sp. H6(2020)]
MAEADLGQMPWRARIRDAGHHIKGGGLLLGVRHVLTCAHVVAEYGSPPPEVLIDFVGLPGRPAVPARVSASGWIPAAPGGQGDLALLELAEPVEVGSGAVLRRIPAAERRDVRVYGFPRGADYGIWRSGRVTGPGLPGSGWIQLDVDGPVEPGSSGCPVVDTATGRPLGILVASDRQNSAWMIPVEEILRHFPQLARWTAGESALEERLDQLVVAAGGSRALVADDLYVSLPKGDLPDLEEALLADPSVPERVRYCASCGIPVGRSESGAPRLDRGYCKNCGEEFDFAPRLGAGDLVDGRYAVLGCLAYGGISWIHLARDEAEDRIVVLKGLMRTGERIGEMWTEAARYSLPYLIHPNLARAYEFVDHRGPAAGRPDRYLVMEYVRGMSLRSVMRRAKRLRLEHVASYGLQILSALGYLHEHGLLYCDMKPDNVLQTGDRIKVIDPGAIRGIGDRTSPVVGTPRYQPPREELRQHGVTVRSDIYAAGQTVKELLEACDGRPDGVGWKSLQLIVARATAEYAERFVTAGEMADQLRGALRQILALRDGVPRPGRSTVFTGSTALLTGGLRIPEWTEWREDPFHGCATAPPVDRVVASLPQVRQEHAWGELAEAWASMVRDLAGPNEGAAGDGLRRCAALAPGELAPWLALGFHAERLGDLDEAESCFRAVWARDRREVAAAFGLARVLLRSADRVGAAAVLDDVPDSAEHALEARVAAIRALAALLPGVAVPPTAEEAATALQRLPLTGLSNDAGERLTAVVLETALWLGTKRAEFSHRLPGVGEIRRRLEGIYRAKALDTAMPADLRDALQSHARRVRNPPVRPGTSPPRPEARSNRPVPIGETEVPVLVTVTPVSPAAELALRVTTTPGHRLRSMRRLSPDEAEIPVAADADVVVVHLGTWAGEPRDYQLVFTADQPAAVDEEVQLAEIVAETAAARSPAEPVLVRWTDAVAREPVGAGSGTEGNDLTEAIETAMAALRAGEPAQALVALGGAVVMAAEQGNDEVLRRLSRLVDIVDAETGLVSFRGAVRGELEERDFFSERLSIPLREPELVGSGLVTAVWYDRIEPDRDSSLSMDTYPGAGAAPPLQRPAEPLPAVEDVLQASVRCLTDGPIVPGQPARVSVAVHRSEPLAPLPSPVRLRVLLDAVPGAVEPVSRLAWLTVDRYTDPVEFDVVPVEPGHLPLVFRVYRDFDSHLLMEITAALPVVRTGVRS